MQTRSSWVSNASQSRETLLRRNAKGLELLRAVRPVLSSTDFFVDLQDLSILADVESPAERYFSRLSHNAVRFGNVFLGIAQDRIVEIK